MMTNPNPTPYVPQGTYLDLYHEITKHRERNIFALAPLVEQLYPGDWTRNGYRFFFEQQREKAKAFWGRPVISFEQFYRILQRSKREWACINRDTEA